MRPNKLKVQMPIFIAEVNLGFLHLLACATKTRKSANSLSHGSQVSLSLSPSRNAFGTVYMRKCAYVHISFLSLDHVIVEAWVGCDLIYIHINSLLVFFFW